MKKQYEPVAYHAMQYAPTLCIWREVGDIDAFTHDSVRIGYMGDAGRPTSRLCWQAVKYSDYGRAYVRYNNRRYYLDEFLRF